MPRLADTAYEELRDQILSGELPHGERLAEEEIADNLGISRTPVREALRRLTAEGLVEFAPNRGASVAKWGTADLEEIFDLRAVLESHATWRAATRIDASRIEELAQLCDEMEALFANGGDRTSLEDLAERNRHFHQAISEAAQSPRMSAMIGSLTHVPIVMQTFTCYSGRALDRSLRHHREIVEALRARDAAWAGSVMRAHILAARDEVLGDDRPSPS